MIGNIKIYGQIGTIGSSKGVDLIDVISQVRKQPESTGFNVYIDSEGGLVDVGFDIYNYLISLGLPITTIGEKLVASISTVIFMAGQRRLVSPDTRFMIHLPMGGIENATAEEMEEYTKSVKTTEEKIVSFYSKALNISKEAISPLLKNETWLTLEQLNSLGFTSSGQSLAISAKANRKINLTKMNTKKETWKARLQKLLNTGVVNKVLFTADERELVFPDVPDDGAVDIGATATIDGLPAEGEIVLQDGRTYVFDAGTLIEIREVEDGMEEEIVEAFEAILEVAAETQTRVAALEGQMTGIIAERDDLKKTLTDAHATIAKLKGSSTKAVTLPKEQKQEPTSPVATWLASKKNKKA